MARIEINGRIVEVDDSFRSLSPEEQQRTVEEIASSMQPAAPAQAPMNEENNPLKWLNRGIGNFADTLTNLPTQVVNAGIRGGAGLLGVEDPYQFEAFTPVGDVMNAAGITAEGDPTQNWQRFAMGSGEALGAVIPVGLAANAARGVGGVVGGFADDLAGQLASAPARFAASEAAAGGGAAVGANMAAERYGEDSYLAQLLGGMAGGIAGGVGPSLLAQGTGAVVRNSPGIRLARDVIAREAAPFTETGARQIARERLQGLTADPAAAIAAIDAGPQSLTPAQRTGESGLMMLENSIIARDPAAQAAFNARMGDVQTQGMTQTARLGGPVGPARTVMGDNIAAQNAVQENAVAQALMQQDEALAALAPQRSAAENSLSVREALDSAYSAAKANENELWGLVPRDTTIPLSNARNALSSEIDRAGLVSQDSVPNEARTWLGPNGLGAAAPVSEARSLYSVLRDTQRNASSGLTPNSFTASSAGNIARALLDDFEAAGDAVGVPYANARQATRQLHETFDRDIVGRALSQNANGLDALAPERILDVGVGTGGSRGLVGVNALRSAGGDAVMPPLEDYLRGRLGRSGEVTPSRIEGFRRNYGDILNEAPSVAQALLDAEGAFSNVASARVTATELADRLAASPTGRFTAAPTGSEFESAVLAATNPTDAAREVIAAAEGNPFAVQGLKGSIIDYMFRRAEGAPDETGRRAFRGNEFNSLLRNPDDNTFRQAISQIFTPDEMQRLDEFSDAMRLLDMSRSAGTTTDITDAKPNSYIQYIGGTIAARYGASLGAGSGATLRTSSEAVKRFNAILNQLTGGRAEQLITTAITEDPDLFKALLSPVSSEADAERVTQRIRRWAEATAATQIAEDQGTVLPTLVITNEEE